jgi:hypothetical protein
MLAMRAMIALQSPADLGSITGWLGELINARP